MYLHRLSVCIALGMKPEATRRPVAITTYPRVPLVVVRALVAARAGGNRITRLGEDAALGS